MKPAFVRTFSASAIVLFLTSGTVIKSESSVDSASDGIPKYGKISVNICETTGPANVPPWWLLFGGLYKLSNKTTWVSSTGEIAT